MAYQSINPNDGKLLKSFEHLTPAQLEKSLAGAQHATRPRSTGVTRNAP